MRGGTRASKSESSLYENTQLTPLCQLLVSVIGCGNCFSVRLTQHSLVYRSILRLWDKKPRPHSANQSQAPKNEANFATQVGFVGIHEISRSVGQHQLIPLPWYRPESFNNGPGCTHGMTVLATTAHIELTHIPMPTVFERSFAEPTSAKMT